MCKGNAGRGRGHGRFFLLGVSQASPGEGVVQRGNYWGSRMHNDSVWGKVRYAHRTLTCQAQGGYRPPVSGGLFDLFQVSLIEEDVLSLEDSDSEYFDTAEAGSSADEMDDCLSAVSEGLAVAEITGPKSSKRQALIRQESQGGLCRGRPEGNRSHPEAPPMWGVPWRGVGSGSLT